MFNHRKRFAVVLGGVFAVGLGCVGGDDDASVGAQWAALMDDGDVSAVAPGAMVPPPPVVPPPRFCPSGDCARDPLAFWKMDDCNPFSTELADSAFSGFGPHDAFRSVSVACVAGIDNQAVQLVRDGDIVYAPDQPDFVFDQGLTIAAWIKPDRVTGTQSIVRKRLQGTSSFLLAIDGKKLSFVVRLTNGRVVGVSAPIQAGRFTHVAATHDGQQAVLYVDGVAAARARAVGSIGPGVGPILIGNDADGREMKGIIDEVWLNTLAAPPDVIQALTCIRRPPVATLSPSESPPQQAGATVPYDLAITNPSSASCPADTFEYFGNVGFPLSADNTFGFLSVGPGQTAHVAVNVTSDAGVNTVGSFPFQYFVANTARFDAQTTAQATYVIGSLQATCVGVPPQTSQIFGAPNSPAGGLFTFAAPGLVPPTASVVFNPDQALQITANPGATTDPANSFLGAGFGFGNPPCLDARAFTGMTFTITGDVGTCQLFVALASSEDNGVANGPFGHCTDAACAPPIAGPFTAGTHVVSFADFANGNPQATLDPSALNAISWTLIAPTDGVTPPCVANFQVSNVAFTGGPTPPAVNYTFDRDPQGWFLNDFNGPPFTNLAVAPPPGSMPATLRFNPVDGDPAPGSLQVAVPFSALDQFADAIVPLPFPGIDLTGQTLHARVKLVAGSFPEGGVQLHALSGPGFVFAGNFVGADQFPPGVWVPLTLDLTAAAATTPGFDPTQIIQIGVQLFSGDGFPSFTGTTSVFEIDTVTD